MRVLTNSLQDFIANLEQSEVVEKTVWITRTENPEDGDRRGAVKWRIDFQASAVCLFGEGEFLLELGVACGLDYRDSSNEHIGSEEAKRLRGELESFCRDRGLTLRPGTIDM